MVAILARLKLRLVRAGLRGSGWKIAGLVVGGLYGVGALAAWWLIVGIVLADDPAVLHLVGLLGMAVLGLTWLLGSLVFFGTDETLDPSRFALLPVPAPRLMPGLLLAGLIGLPGAGTVLAAAVLPVAWARWGPGPLVAALLAVPLGVVSILLLVRATATALSSMLSSRRFRDVAAVLVATVAISAGVLVNLATSAGRSFGSDWPGYRIAAEILTWTPLGAAWALPGEVAEGRWGRAATLLAVGLAWVALLWWVWGRQLTTALTTPATNSSGVGRVAGGRGVERIVGTGPAGAIAVRCLRYWRRDPRYVTSLVSYVLLPVIVASPVLMTGGEIGSSARFVVALVGLLFGATVAADLCYDSDALWLHIASGTRGVDDRRGRALAAGVAVGPILLLVLLGAALVDAPERIVGTSALLLAYTLAGAGVGSWVGALLQGVVPQPGESAFARGGGGSLVNLVVMVATAGGTFVAGLPTLACVLLSGGRLWMDVLGLVLALAVGLVCYLGGTALGGRRLDSHWPEVLGAITP